jgi:NSS family neurotransmitter:Na+ symporter
MGFNIMDFCDLLTANVLLPLGSILTCVLLGWFVPRHILHDEFTNHHTLASTFFRLWLFAVRYVCPTAIIAIFLHQLGWI